LKEYKQFWSIKEVAVETAEPKQRTPYKNKDFKFPYHHKEFEIVEELKEPVKPKSYAMK
jgi:hypothetical protein